MKALLRNFLLTIALFYIVHNSYGQCTPGNYTFPGIYPNVSDGLDTAYVDSLYEMVMTAVIPKDTLVMGNKLPIDSIGIMTFKGLPYGFTAQPNSPSGYWPGGSKGCVLITGTPADSQVGDHILKITVIAVVAGMPAPFVLPNYILRIVNKTDIQLIAFDENVSLRVIPNPFNQNGFISYYSPSPFQACLQLIDLNGRTMFSQNVDIRQGFNRICPGFKALAPGTYLLRLMDGLKNPSKIIVIAE